MSALTTSFGTQAEIVRSGSSGRNWTNSTSGALTNENTFSVYGMAIPDGSPVYSDWLVVSAPSGLGAMGDADTVNGITVNVSRRDLNSAPAAIKVDTSLIHFSTVATSAPNGTGKSSTTTWPVSEAIESFGGSSDLWGHASLVGSQMKAAGASVWISARLLWDSIDPSSAEIDFINMTVDYNVVSGQPMARRFWFMSRTNRKSERDGRKVPMSRGGILLPPGVAATRRVLTLADAA